jgi:phage shock protein PspC (stress-responsive transcriptional regulator)
MRPARPEGALLAGVCAGIARAWGWNVWALRALFVLFLLVKPVWALIAYAVLALGFGLLEYRRGEPGREAGSLESPELADRNRRIAELERRFQELEGHDRKPRAE